jgi:hypothetical protein
MTRDMDLTKRSQVSTISDAACCKNADTRCTHIVDPEMRLALVVYLSTGYTATRILYC